MKFFIESLSNLIIFDGDFTDFDDIGDIYNGIMAFMCVVCAGLAAGLTIGLLSLDVTKLEIKSMTGNNNEKKAALKVLPVVKEHHLLLVTLLLFNSLANETLPIFLGALVPNYVAVIMSVTLVLFFGEIIPSAVFTGPDQLLTAARMTGFVYFLIGFFYPIAYPISKLLDYILGCEESSSSITRTELEALVILQGKHTPMKVKHPVSDIESQDDHVLNVRISSDMTILTNDQETDKCESDSQTSTSGLTVHEINLMTGILRLSKMSISSAMISLNQVYMVSSDTRLDDKGLYSILDSGFSRILVHRHKDKMHLLGYLLVKELIVINSNDNIRAENLTLREPLFVKPSTGLLEMLNIFQSGQCHLALVSANPDESLRCLRAGQRSSHVSAAILGIVTLEDIIERIIQNEIRDETDQCTPRYSGKKVNVITPTQRRPVVSPTGATTVLYRQLMKVNSRKKLASCPDLVSSPQLATNRRRSNSAGRRGMGQSQDSLSHAVSAADQIGMSYDESDGEMEKRFRGKSDKDENKRLYNSITTFVPSYGLTGGSISEKSALTKSAIHAVAYSPLNTFDALEMESSESVIH